MYQTPLGQNLQPADQATCAVDRFNRNQLLCIPHANLLLISELLKGFELCEAK